MKYSQIDSVITAFIVDNSNLNELKWNQVKEVRTLTDYNDTVILRVYSLVNIVVFTQGLYIDIATMVNIDD